MNQCSRVFSSLMATFDLTLTWKHLLYDVGKVADNLEHLLFSQILIGHMWGVISEKQNRLSGSGVFFLLHPTVGEGLNTNSDHQRNDQSCIWQVINLISTCNILHTRKYI